MTKGMKRQLLGVVVFLLLLALGVAVPYRPLDLVFGVVTAWFVILLSIHQVRIWRRQHRAGGGLKDDGLAARTWHWFYGE